MTVTLSSTHVMCFCFIKNLVKMRSIRTWYHSEYADACVTAGGRWSITTWAECAAPCSSCSSTTSSAEPASWPGFLGFSSSMCWPEDHRYQHTHFKSFQLFVPKTVVFQPSDTFGNGHIVDFGHRLVHSFLLCSLKAVRELQMVPLMILVLIPVMLMSESRSIPVENDIFWDNVMTAYSCTWQHFYFNKWMCVIWRGNWCWRTHRELSPNAAVPLRFTELLAHCCRFRASNISVLVQSNHPHQPGFQLQEAAVFSEKAPIKTQCST